MSIIAINQFMITDEKNGLKPDTVNDLKFHLNTHYNASPAHSILCIYFK